MGDRPPSCLSRLTNAPLGHQALDQKYMTAVVALGGLSDEDLFHRLEVPSRCAIVFHCPFE